MNGIERQIDKLGRIVLPISYRRQLNLEENSTVTISLINDSIIITSQDQRCAICGNNKDLHKEIALCQKCIRTVKKLV